ncbi:maleylpyruvate isomerase family mycothiol-dependent enzyme [Nonomuraea sp. NPDC050643]|uniref:maleylpyruvate isomerase family mycothiol-dependent enzyme n=1 Tax=Nonomuraea sp. NPDC050643 TaxID=3155660 RepID=UPI0033DE4321
MDFAAHFRREVRAFHDAATRAAGTGDAPSVPSCPGWSMSDLVFHLGGVHRGVHVIIKDQLKGPPDLAMLAATELPGGTAGLPDTADTADTVDTAGRAGAAGLPEGWPVPDQAPNFGPIPPTLLDWFAEGADRLERQFRERRADEPAWTWSEEQTVGFWQRMQTIEAAIHRWDAENALNTAGPIADEVAVDAISQTFEVMAPARRSWGQAPPGAGERYRFRRTDGPGEWVVCFDGRHVRVGDGEADVELAGTASDLMLFLWHRIPADGLDIQGDKTLLDRYFVLVPPI